MVMDRYPIAGSNNVGGDLQLLTTIEDQRKSAAAGHFVALRQRFFQQEANTISPHRQFGMPR